MAVDEKTIQSAADALAGHIYLPPAQLKHLARVVLDDYESSRAASVQGDVVERVARALVKEIRSDATNKKAADAVLLHGAEERGIISEAVIGVRIELAKAALAAIDYSAVLAENERLRHFLQKIATGTGDNPDWAVEQAKQALAA